LVVVGPEIHHRHAVERIGRDHLIIAAIFDRDGHSGYEPLSVSDHQGHIALYRRLNPGIEHLGKDVDKNVTVIIGRILGSNAGNPRSDEVFGLGAHQVLMIQGTAR
jgi:hypothetical protein